MVNVDDTIILNLISEANRRALSRVKNCFQGTSEFKNIQFLAHQCQLEIDLIKIDIDPKLQEYDLLNNYFCSKVDCLKKDINKTIRYLTESQKNKSLYDKSFSDASYSRQLFEYMRKVNNAKQNIQTIFDKVKTFQSVASDIQYLNERKLHATDREASSISFFPIIEDVAMLQRLELWRDEVIDEILTIEEEEAFPNVALNNNINLSFDLHPEEESYCDKPSLRAYFRGILDDVTELSDFIRASTKDKILDCIYWGQKNPAYLVHIVGVFEYISQQDERISVNKKIKSKVHHESTFKQKTLQLLAKSIGDTVQRNFSSYMFKAVDENMSVLEATLGAVTDGMINLIVFKGEISPCFPKTYGLNEIYMQHFTDFIVPQIKQLYHRSKETLSVQDLIRLISWLEHYDLQMKSIDSKSTHPEFLQDVKYLVLEYINRVKSQIHEWLDNILRRERYVFQNSNGLYISSNPEDIISSLSIQLSVAKENLPSGFMVELKAVCIEELHRMNQILKNDVERNWESMHVEEICSIINDTSLMHDMCEQFFMEGKRDENLEMKINDLCVEYVELSVYITNFLAKLIYIDLDNPIMSRIFSQNWEDEEQLMETAVSTLEDYFEDLRTWLAPFFLSKCRKSCFELIIQSYIEMCFIPHKKKLNDSLVASRRVSLDRLCLISVFEKNINVIREKKEMIERLDILESISKLLIITDPEDAYQDLNKVLKCLPIEYGSSVMITFIQLRKDISSVDLSKWRNVIKIVAQLQELPSLTVKKMHTYHLPYAATFRIDNKSVSSTPTKVQNKEELSSTSSLSRKKASSIAWYPTSEKGKSPLKKTKFSHKIKDWASRTHPNADSQKRKFSVPKLYPKMNVSLASVKVKLRY